MSKHRLVVGLLVCLAASIAIVCGLVAAIVLMVGQASVQDVIFTAASTFAATMVLEVAVLALFLSVLSP